MQIQATAAAKSAAPSGFAPAPVPVPKQKDPSAPPPSTPPDDPTQAIVDKIITSQAFSDSVMGKMSHGSEVTIEVGDKQVIRIKSDGPGLMERFAVGTKAVVGSAASEVSGVVKSDPAFAFKEAALGVKSQVYTGLPSEIQKAADVGFLPMLRVVTLALDFKKFMDTRKNPESSKMDKVVDGGHLVTDVAGVAGAVAFSVPALGPLAVPLTVVGLTGDVAAFTYHILDYIKERGAAYAESKKQKEEQPPAPPAPQQPPSPPPTTLTMAA